jgi:hypothetical protein
MIEVKTTCTQPACFIHAYLLTIGNSPRCLPPTDPSFADVLGAIQIVSQRTTTTQTNYFSGSFLPGDIVTVACRPGYLLYKDPTP